MQGQSSCDNSHAQNSYFLQMFNASTSRFVQYDDAQDTSSGIGYNRWATTYLPEPCLGGFRDAESMTSTPPNSEFQHQVLNFNGQYRGGSGVLEGDRELGIPRHESSHIQLFGARIELSPSGLSGHQFQHRNAATYASAVENYYLQTHLARGTYPWTSNFFGSSSSYANDVPENHEHLRYQNNVNGGTSVQETGNFPIIHPFEVSTASTPVLPSSYYSIGHIEAALRNLKQSSDADGYGGGPRNINDDSIRLGGINESSMREAQETREGVVGSSQVFLEATGERNELNLLPFFAVRQESAAERESPVPEEVHLEEEIGNGDMHLDAAENPLQDVIELEDESDDDVVIIIDISALEEEYHMGEDIGINAAIQEDHDEVEDSDDDEMELDVDNMSYEEVLALEEQIGNVSTGLSKAEIFARLRRYRYSAKKRSSPEEEDLCVICMDKFVGRQEIGVLDCNHKFHGRCIKKWLMQNNSCPVCRMTGLAS